MKTLQWEQQSRLLICEGQVFDPSRLEWVDDDTTRQPAESVTPTEALLRFAERMSLRRVPIGIIGPRQATPEQCEFADRLGAAIADHGLQLLCGGRMASWKPPAGGMRPRVECR